MRKTVITGTLVALLAFSSAVPTWAAEPASAGGSFRAAGSLEAGRLEHTTTLLPNGGVLVIGGTGDDGIIATAELWDPVSESFGPAGSLVEARSAHTATLTPDGGVLVVGGYNDDGSLASMELWDPVSMSFSAAGSLAEARNSHTATSLADGGVLIAGGLTNDLANLPISAELWDPGSGTVSPAGSLAEGRGGHTATLTPDGVLVVGGVDLVGTKRSSAELWVPSSMTFIPAGSLIEERAGHTATLLPDSVLVIGGVGADSTLASTERWDPGTGTFIPAGTLAETRNLHTATLLPDGRVLVVGGVDLIDLRASAESWDPASGSFGSTGSLSGPRAWHTATLLPDGGVLIVGGSGDDGSAAASAELWTLGAEPSSSAESSPAPSDPVELDSAMLTMRLMNLPPIGIMETCRPSSASLDGLVAIVACSFGADVVIYANFDEAASLTAAYQDIVASAAVQGGTSSCSEGAFEGPYLGADGAAAGRVLCQTDSDGTIAAWTDDRNVVMGFLLLNSGGGFPELHDHWLQVRLDAAAPGGASPSPAGTSPSPASGTAEPAVSGAEIRQWAVSATASSEYTPTEWSASQATGSPDAPQYGGHTVSWAPLSDPGTPEWLELTYEHPVVPTEVNIWEANGAGFVVQVEALDDATGEWLTLWQGTDPTPAELLALSPPLIATDISTRRIRVTAGPGADGYPYIDAVELVGVSPE